MAKYRDFLAMERRGRDDWPLKLAVKTVGLQEIDPNDESVLEMELNASARIWVLNAQVQITEDGEFLIPEASPFVWLGDMRRSKSGTENVACSKFTSIVPPLKPIDSRQALRNLIQAMQASYLNNFPSALLALGAQVLNLHYEMVLSVAGGVPVALLYGDVQCGKSRSMEAALSLLGTQRSHFLKRSPDM